MRDERRTSGLAWLILVLSFISCVTLAVGTPMGIRWYIAHATRPLEVKLQPRAGVVTFQTGRSSALNADQTRAREVYPKEPHRSLFLRRNAEGGFLLFLTFPNGTGQPVSTLPV